MVDWLKWSAATFALVATLWGGFTAFDGRYARAADMRQQVDGLKALYLQQQVMALEREEFELVRELQRRRLSAFEEHRLSAFEEHRLSAFEEHRLNAVKRQLDYLRPQLRAVAP